MAFKVTLIHHGERTEFAASAAQSIARSAEAVGVILTTGCRQGRCAICRARLVSGSVAGVRRRSPNAVGDPAHRADGCVLLCSVAPTSDVVIAPRSPWRVESVAEICATARPLPGGERE